MRSYKSITKSIIGVCLILFLFSCNSKNGQQNAGNDDFKKLDTIIPFAGAWLCQDYWNSINEFKSPRKAQDSSNFIVIPDRTLKQTIMVYNFHEGNDFLTVVKKGAGFELWTRNEDRIDTFASDIEVIAPDKIKIYGKVFVKVDPVTVNGENLILEEILFKGIYTDGKGKEVQFKNNGEVTGLDSFHHYKPLIDYWDAGLQVDQVEFETPGNKSKYLAFKFKKDTLELYEVKCLAPDASDGCYEVDFGELVYKLWKTK